MNHQGIRAIRTTCTFASMTLALVIAGPAMAGGTTLGDSGWRATWSSSLDGLVDIDFIGIEGTTLFIQKSAEFTAGPVNGVFSAVPITFRQVAASDITHIVIDDEIITNSTGTSWTGFHFKLLDHGDATFDIGATSGSGGPGPIGFGVAPFTTAQFTEEDTKLKLAGGVVQNGGIWNPGRGQNQGQLWISVNSGEEGDFTTFTLKERPVAAVIPGPSALLCLAGAFGFIRRRRRA